MKLVYVNQATEKIYSFPDHSHPYWEILLTIEGYGEETVEGVSHELSPGTILIIPPGTVHGTVSKKGLRDFSVTFEDFPPIQGNHLLVLKDPEEQSVYALMTMILKAVRHAPPNTAQLTDALGMSLYQLLRAYAQDLLREKPVVGELKREMMEHLGDSEFDLGRVMDKTGYSRGYLRRTFKLATGMAPLAWLLRQRIAFAAQTFRQYAGVYTVRQVAALSGFSDPYYFSRIFKQYMGQSPTKYIEKSRMLTKKI